MTDKYDVILRPRNWKNVEYIFSGVEESHVKAIKEMIRVEMPKPLLADAQVGWVCKHRNGEWSQIIDTNGTYITGQPVRTTLKDSNGINRNFCLSGCHFTMQFGGEYDIIHTEPLAAEGTAEWAWQMNKLLGKKVMHAHSNLITDGNIMSTNKDVFLAITFDTGWQLYEPSPQPDLPVSGEVREPEPDQSDSILCTALNNKRLCKVLLSDKNYLIITDTEPYFKEAYDMMKNTEQANGTWAEEDQQFYDRLFPSPQPQVKVGDWVLQSYAAHLQRQVKIVEIAGEKFRARIQGLLLNSWFDMDSIIRKLDNSEVKVSITLSGTVKSAGELGFYIGSNYVLYSNCTPSDAELVRELTGGGE